jgi:hypothetical protein
MARPDEVRAYDVLARLDAQLRATARERPSKSCPGPIADARARGQLTLMRRLSGTPIRGENYLRAEIASGRVGPEQVPPKGEFG